MWSLRCPYCSSTQSRHTTSTSSSRTLTECSSCGRIIQEHHHPPIHISLFPLRSHLNPLPLVTPDLQQQQQQQQAAAVRNQQNQEAEAEEEDDDDQDEEEEEEGEGGDPFHPTGFITAFSTFSLERSSPVLVRASPSPFSGLLADLQRALLLESSSSSPADSDDPMVSVDHLRAYLHILDVASILGLEHDVSEHAFQLFKDCLLVACLRNRSIEALATAALVQAIREAQEPRTLQEISTASNLPQKEIGKYMKILGEALKLSQPINSNSISVHMPRFCTLLQLNKSAQELAAHIGEVVINKCFCTRRNPISISAAAIYLACQLEDKRKTQAEICKVTGLTEVTLRKVYKELLENWDDLLPANYTPAVPPEKAFPMTSISSGRSSTPKVENPETSDIKKPSKDQDVEEIDHQVKITDEVETKSGTHERSLASLYTRDLNQAAFWQPQFQFGVSTSKQVEKEQKNDQALRIDEAKFMRSDREQNANTELKTNNTARRMGQNSTITSSQKYANPWQFNVPGPSSARFGKPQAGVDSGSAHQGLQNKMGKELADG